MSRAIPKSPIFAILPAPGQVSRQFLAAISLGSKTDEKTGFLIVYTKHPRISTFGEVQMVLPFALYLCYYIILHCDRNSHMEDSRPGLGERLAKYGGLNENCPSQAHVFEDFLVPGWQCF